MGTYKRFEDLPAWKDAARLYVSIEDLVKDNAFKNHGDMRDQLLRATLSISNNIAEGFERGSTNDLIRFIYYARGSAGEVRSMLQVMSGSQRFSHLKSQISDLKSPAESISRQLRGWVDQLQNSDIAGQRHLNDASRKSYDQRKSADAFNELLERARKGEKVEWGPMPDD